MTELDVRTRMLLVGLIVGVLYGVVAQATRFCIRRGISDLAEGRGAATLSAWFAALLVALPMTQWMFLDGHLSLEGMVYFPANLSLWSTVLGAAVFGLGMMLTRGCPARLTVLAASGNLRAWFGLFVIGLSAYATFKGVLAATRLDMQASGAIQLPQASVFVLAGAPFCIQSLATYYSNITTNILDSDLVLLNHRYGKNQFLKKNYKNITYMFLRRMSFQQK